MKRFSALLSLSAIALGLSAGFATRTAAVEIQGWKQIDGSSVVCEASITCDNQPGVACTFNGLQLYQKSGSQCATALTRSNP